MISIAGQCQTNPLPAVPDWPCSPNADAGLTLLTSDQNADAGLTFPEFTFNTSSVVVIVY
jgi:hypothetical protein